MARKGRQRRRLREKSTARAKIDLSPTACLIVESTVMPAEPISAGGWFPSSPSSLPSSEAELPVIATDCIGMIVDDGTSHIDEHVANDTRSHLQRRPRKYVSKHFRGTKKAVPAQVPTPPITPQKGRVIAGVKIDELSSDSELTDLPEDIGPDPFDLPAKLTKIKAAKAKNPSKSPYFPNKPRPQFLSCLPFPPLSDTTFGLMQERLAHDPFRLLIATIFLNKTPGARAMPVFYRLMERYPTPADLAKAEVADVTSIIRELGFQNQRARKCVGMAKMWLDRPPSKGKRYRKLNYPKKGDHKDVKVNEMVDDADERVAWEISHLPGVGPYSHDSWRMFCRDELRGVASGYLGEHAEADFEPEWKRVVPTDKELRAWLTWMWLKEGWSWNKETGERTKADAELMERARGGGIVQEKAQTDHLLVTAGEAQDVKARTVEEPAGHFLDLGSNGEGEAKMDCERSI